MPRRANINRKIEEIMHRGHPVYSLALGRVGHISFANQHGIAVRHWTHSVGWTTFNKGDKVKIVRNDRRQRYEVVNTFEEMKND